jgi:hypothetical protein
MLDAIGWIATAVFSISYLFKSGSTLRRVQAIAAVLWIAYGVAISAKPVIVANIIVAVSAIISALSTRASTRNQVQCTKE